MIDNKIVILAKLHKVYTFTSHSIYTTRQQQIRLGSSLEDINSRDWVSVKTKTASQTKEMDTGKGLRVNHVGRRLCIFKRSDFRGMRRPGFTIWWCAGCIENGVFYNVYFNFQVRAAESRRLLIRLRGWIAQTRNSEGESSPSRGRRRVCPRRFSSSFPWRYASFLRAVETRRNERFFFFSFFSSFWNKISSQRLTDRFLFAGNWSFRKELEIKGSLSLFSFAFVSFSFTFLFSSLSLSHFFSSSFRSSFLSSFSDFSVFIREETLKDFYLLILRSKMCFHFLEKLKYWKLIPSYVIMSCSITWWLKFIPEFIPHSFLNGIILFYILWYKSYE